MSLFGLAALVGLVVSINCQNDKMIYDISSQAKCTEITRGATHDCRWAAGMSMQVDQVAAGGKIAAYKIKWSYGWSGWYVPGYNDIDGKVNLRRRRCLLSFKANSLRRVWSYFYDHDHMFIVCKA